MNRISTMIFATGLAVLGGCGTMKTAIHPDFLNERSYRTAVLAFHDDFDFGDELADTLVTELLNKGHVVIERSQVDQILGEQRIQYSGAFDPRTLAENGQISGVDFLVVGSLSTRPVTPALEWLLGEGVPHMQVDLVNVRWINVRSGQVMASARFRNPRGGSLEGIARRIVRSFDEALRQAEQQNPAPRGLDKVAGRPSMYALK